VKIDIKGQVFDVSPDVLDGILSAMTQTAQDGVEHGFLMCELPDKTVVKGKECVGTSCSINLTDCKKAGGKTVGNFHSHPDVISFSLSDYIHSIQVAKEHPDKKQLMCVALKDAGIRCKALTSMPPDDFSLPSLEDNEQNRSLIKPFFTKKVSIGKNQIHELLSGKKWEQLSPEDQIIAIDEGDVVVPTELFGSIGTINIPGKGSFPLKSAEELKKMADQKKSNWAAMAEAMGLPPEEGGGMAKKSLVEVAQQFINEPTGKYPWETKTVTKSVATPMGVGLEMAGMPTLESDETKFVATRDIEIPDPSLIHYGEVAGYIAAISPVILTKNKDDNGKWKILDGRHRLAAWRAAGYKQVPVVFSTDEDYK